MSTLPTSAMTAQGPSIKVVSHSMLFYWWPVWAIGFVLALLTYIDGHRLAIVPRGTTIRALADGQENEFLLTVPPKSGGLKQAAEAVKDPFPQHVAQNKNYGIVFVVALLLVIFITNVPLRGLWSLVAILLIVLATLLLAYFDLWDPILEGLGSLHIYMTAAGYFCLAVVLFIVWLVVFFIFDPRRYMVFSPGQLVVHREVGDMRQVYDTVRLTVEKRRSDLFRHWILGLGSGDLIVNVPGSQTPLELPNVLLAAHRVQQIADLMKTRPVVSEKL